MGDVLATVDAPHFYAGIVLRGAVVAEAAPILRYMIGWDARRVKAYCDRKGWTVARVATASPRP